MTSVRLSVLGPLLRVVLSAAALSACGATGAVEAGSTSSSQPSATQVVSARPTTDAAAATQAADAAAAKQAAEPAPFAAPAQAGARVFRNCDELNGVYPHGVGRPGAVDHVSGGKPGVTTFTRDAAVYEANPGRDGDHDGIACEKK
jgi:hypothetical protein